MLSLCFFKLKENLKLGSGKGKSILNGPTPTLSAIPNSRVSKISLLLKLENFKKIPAFMFCKQGAECQQMSVLHMGQTWLSIYSGVTDTKFQKVGDVVTPRPGLGHRILLNNCTMVSNTQQTS